MQEAQLIPLNDALSGWTLVKLDPENDGKYFVITPRGVSFSRKFGKLHNRPEHLFTSEAEARFYALQVKSYIMMIEMLGSWVLPLIEMARKTLRKPKKA